VKAAFEIRFGMGEKRKMKHAVSLDRAKTIIQGWYNQFCKEYGKPAVTLDVEEEEDAGSRAYIVVNQVSGGRTAIPWSTVSDYEASGSVGIPGDSKTSGWDSMQDLG
jgi:hypothetical protein